MDLWGPGSSFESGKLLLWSFLCLFCIRRRQHFAIFKLKVCIMVMEKGYKNGDILRIAASAIAMVISSLPSRKIDRGGKCATPPPPPTASYSLLQLTRDAKCSAAGRNQGRVTRCNLHQSFHTQNPAMKMVHFSWTIISDLTCDTGGDNIHKS